MRREGRVWGGGTAGTHAPPTPAPTEPRESTVQPAVCPVPPSTFPALSRDSAEDLGTDQARPPPPLREGTREIK